MKKLPDKLSDLFTVALNDLQKCMADPIYSINMSCWMQWDTVTQKCEVCMAGAVMAQTLDIPIKNTHPRDDIYMNAVEGTDIKDKLSLIDGFRLLSFRDMLVSFIDMKDSTTWNEIDDLEDFCMSLKIDVRKAQDYIPQYRQVIEKIKEMGL